MTIEWKPIKTVPKDGTIVLLGRFGRERNEPGFVVAFYDKSGEYPWAHIRPSIFATFESLPEDWGTHWAELTTQTGRQWKLITGARGEMPRLERMPRTNLAEVAQQVRAAAS